MLSAVIRSRSRFILAVHIMMIWQIVCTEHELATLAPPTVATATIRCGSKQEAEDLAYRVCSSDIICRDLYHLDQYNTRGFGAQTARNSFLYQLSQLGLIIDASHYHQDSDADQISTEHNLSPSWLAEHLWFSGDAERLFPTASMRRAVPTLIHGTGDIGDDCRLVDFGVTVSMLHFMIVYRGFITMDHHCSDINERPIVNTDTNKLQCVCLPGKVCGEQQNYFNLFYVVIILLGLLVVIATITHFYGSYHIIRTLKNARLQTKRTTNSIVNLQERRRRKYAT